MPGGFERHYVDDEYGVPFLRGSNIVEFRPDNIKYLSPSMHSNLDEMRVQQGWVLVTRSGTVARVALVPAEWNQWTATEDVIRIVSSERCEPHYLATFLASPLGKIQLVRQKYGAMVDHLTEENIRSVIVPLPKTPDQSRQVAEVTRLAAKAIELCTEAVRKLDEPNNLLVSGLSDKEPTEFENFERLASKLLGTESEGLSDLFRTRKFGVRHTPSGGAAHSQPHTFQVIKISIIESENPLFHVTLEVG